MRRNVVHTMILAGTLTTVAGCAAVGTVAEAVSNPQAVLSRTLQGCGQVQEYTPGTVVAGEFTASDCYTPSGETRQPVDYYRIRTDGQRDIFAVVEAPGLRVRMALVREDGVEIKSDSYVGDFTFISTQVPAGTYRVALRSEAGISTNDRVYGKYTLRSSTDQVGFEGCPTVQEIQPGSTIQGEWSVSDCRNTVDVRWEKRYFDYYLVNVPRTRDATLTLNSPGINSTLTLFSRDGTPLKEASAIGREAKIATQLSPGAYVIRAGVGSVGERETGRYTLRVH